MQNINRKLAFLLGSLILLVIWSESALCDIRSAMEPLPRRIKASAAYGIGTVNWGATAYSIDGHAELFVYELNYGRNNKITICTEISLYPSQKVLFSLSGEKKHPHCRSSWTYAAVSGSADIIYAGYEDVIGSKIWFQVNSGLKENFGCKDMRTLDVLLNVDGHLKASFPHGVPSGGTYFNGGDLIKCLRDEGLAPYKVR